MTLFELGKCKKDTFVFDGVDYIIKALDFLLKFKGEERKVKSKTVEHKLQFHAHDGGNLDSWIILNNLPSDKHIVDIFKTDKSNIS